MTVMSESENNIVLDLRGVREKKLADMPPQMLDAIVRRVVDGQALTPSLDVAAFNSAV